MESKLALARGIVELYHDPDAAGRAEAHFTRASASGRRPSRCRTAPLLGRDPIHVPALLSSAFGMSTSEARRLIGEGAVRVNGDAIGAFDLPRTSLEGALVQAGKRRFVRLTAA